MMWPGSPRGNNKTSASEALYNNIFLLLLLDEWLTRNIRQTIGLFRIFVFCFLRARSERLMSYNICKRYMYNVIIYV